MKRRRREKEGGNKITTKNKNMRKSSS